MRRAVQAVALILAVVGAGWALWLAIFGGFDLVIGGRTISSNEPLRPMAIAAVGLVLFVATYGVGRAHAWWTRATGTIADGAIVSVLALATVILGFAYSTTAASGPDPYGYVSQAELWLQGNLHVPQPWAAEVPWPSKRWSFAPLGYRPVDIDGIWENVPTYSVGLPLMMAGAKKLLGQDGIFLVVPIFGGLMVLATWGIGRRLGSSRAGVIAAWLVATSPIFIHMLFRPMSDVAVAGAWTVAFYFLLGTSFPAAGAAGLAAAVAILIRPNLFYLAAIMGLWFALRQRPGISNTTLLRIFETMTFAVMVAPGVVITALMYRDLYGSYTTSGYGSFQEQFALASLLPNLRNYFTWFVDTQTAVALVGLAVVLVPIGAVWSFVSDRRIFVIIGLFVGALWAQYCLYLVFDDWLFLRFLLPCWPFLMLGIASAALSLTQADRPALTLAVVGLVCCLGLLDLRVAAQRAAFELWRDDRRFVSVAKHVADATPAGSAVLSMLHSGSLRYYGGRMTVRYDQIDPDWLDRGVAWMTARGVPVYAVLEDWEIPEFERRFQGQSYLSRLSSPVFVYNGTTTVRLYDLSRPPDPAAAPRVINETFEDRRRAVPPAPPPTLTFRR